MKLQMFIQGVTTELEKTTSQVVDDMPRVIKQVDIVQQEVVSLKDRMAVVKRKRLITMTHHYDSSPFKVLT